MFVSNVQNGVKFNAYINSRICIVKSEDYTAKSFVLKSLLKAQFNGYRYSYYNWATYKNINWNGGQLYDRYSVITFDDADLYIQQVIRYLEVVKCTVIVVANSSNASAIMRRYKYAEYYEIACENASFYLRQVPTRCAYCGKVFAASQLTADHIIPQKFCDTYMPGATIKEHFYNKCRVCFACNRAKSDDIWIPNYRSDRWMRFMTPEQVGGFSDIFVQLLQAHYDDVVWWIYRKNMQSHVRYKIKFEEVKPVIEEELKFFLQRYLDRKPGEYWDLI